MLYSQYQLSTINFIDMKKNLLLFAAILFVFADSFAQATFNTGALEVSVNQYGRVRLFDAEGYRHLQRASILVGGNANEVFDYTNDAEEYEPTVLVTSPAQSDFEIYGAYDNAYSDLPPDVIVKLNAYGWNNGAFTIVKFNVTNNEAAALTARVGLDIIPELNEEYGFDTVTYLESEGIVRFHRGAQMNMGMKLLSAPLTSLYSFEWYDGYSADADYWTWMNQGSLQSQYISTTVDGPVTITAQDGFNLEPAASFDVYYALALGADQHAVLENISMAEQKYQAWFTTVGDPVTSSKSIELNQNQPNPFSQTTTISYTLPEDGFVSLKVFNVLGMEVAELVNTNQSAGTYTVSFNGDDLNGGIYFCTLRVNDQVMTNKMYLMK